MSDDPNPSSSYARQALKHASFLGSSPRGSTTPAERAAAEYVVAQMESGGVSNIQVQAFNGLRSMWLFLALVFGLVLVGHAAYWFLRHPLGDYPALLVTLGTIGLAGVMLWRRFTFRSYPLRGTLPHGASQNVIARVAPAGEVKRQVVLLAHLDSHRAVFWFATDFLVKLFGVCSFITLFGVYISAVAYLLAVLTHWQPFAWLGLALALFHFLGWFTGVTADLGKYSPGANDNASSVGTLLALAERLKDQPLQTTDVWLVFTGCEESGCDGVLALIREHGEELKDALFIDLEMVGIGEGLCYIQEEGNLRRKHIPAQVKQLVESVGKPFNLHPVRMPPVGAFTEAGTLWEHDYQAVSISAYVEGSTSLPEWHRLTDTPDRLQLASLERAQKLTWELLQRFDQ